MHRLIDTAISAVCVLLLTTVAVIVTAVSMAIATVDQDSHTPAPSRPANGVSYATTHVCGNRACP